MSPKPCPHCGVNFMPGNPDASIKQLCNNCTNREPKKQKTEEKMESEVKIIITIPRDANIAIEEICMNKGISISEYFLRMHLHNKAEHEYVNTYDKDHPISKNYKHADEIPEEQPKKRKNKSHDNI